MQLPFFEPLRSNDYCSLFYVLMIFNFTFFSLAVAAFVAVLFGFRNLLPVRVQSTAALVIIPNFIAYFQNRILYSMCTNSFQRASSEVSKTAAIGFAGSGDMDRKVSAATALMS